MSPTAEKKDTRPMAAATTAPTPLKRKFENPTPSYVGCVILTHDNKPKGIAVEPGGHVWLSPEEERLTADAPRLPEDNPFVKTWDAIVERHPETGDPIKMEPRNGVLVAADEEARPIGSDRFTPSAEPVPENPPPPAEESLREPPADDSDPAPAAEEPELTAASTPPEPTGPPAEGKPADNEIVATPEAVKANDEELARRKEEGTVPVGERPQDVSAIGLPPREES